MTSTPYWYSVLVLPSLRIKSVGSLCGYQGDPSVEGRALRTYKPCNTLSMRGEMGRVLNDSMQALPEVARGLAGLRKRGSRVNMSCMRVFFVSIACAGVSKNLKLIADLEEDC